ncbi:MAG: methylmalonyl Co-A mutase-associated GTPase MeaB [Haloarculaceae archaeon]
MDDLVSRVLDGDHRALARAITTIENRREGYRDLVAALYPHAGNAEVIGVTGSPGAGKSTLVDKLAAAYRERGLTVGVVAIDPASPFTGGAVLGDRIRMADNAGDMDVFFRSMSARGALGGLSTATSDAVTALDAFGKDRIVVETVGAGQNEIDVVRTADTVVVLVPPGSGDDVQMLKAGILEIADCFVVNKADLSGADRTVQQLREMLELRDGKASGRHATDADGEAWSPPIVETVATRGEGVEDLLDVLDDHRSYLESSGRLDERACERVAAEIRRLLREDVSELVATELDRRGGIDAHVDRVRDGETTPYAVAEAVLAPIRACFDDRDGG